MPVSLLQHALVGGELSPSIQARVDLDRYRTSLALCENFVVRATGGCAFRPGTEFVGITNGGRKVELLPFRAGTDQHYLLELSDHRMRIIYRGGYITAPPAVDSGDTPLTLLMAPTGPAQIKAASKPGGFSDKYIGKNLWIKYSVNDGVPSFIGTILDVDDYGRAVLEYGPFDDFVELITVPSWAISDQVVPPGSVIEVATPWKESDLRLLSYAQSADVMTVCHPDYPPHHIRRVSDYEWEVVPAPIVGGPFGPWNIDESKILMLTKNDSTGIVTGKFAVPAIPAGVVGGTIDVAPDVGIDHWQPDRAYAVGATVRSEGKYYTATTSGTSGTLRPSHTTGVFSDGGVKWKFVSRSSTTYRITNATVVESGMIREMELVPLTEEVPGIYAGRDTDTVPRRLRFSSGNITDASAGAFTLNYSGGHGFPVGVWMRADIFFGPFGPKFYDLEGDVYLNVSVFSLSSTALRCSWGTATDIPYSFGTITITGGFFEGAYGVTSSWRLGAWSKHHGWPRVVTYYQQRQVFGGTYDQPHTLWFSRVGAYTDFGVEFPRADDDALTLTLDSSDRFEICGIAAMNRLLVFTTGGEWVVGTAEPGAPVTIETVRAEKHGFWGSVPGIAPQVAGNTAVFVASQGRAVRDMVYDFARDQYIGNDLTLAVEHLFRDRRIVDWALQRGPNPVLWCVLDDGSVACLTYLQEQGVAAWSRMPTDGFVERVEVVDEGDDRVYFVVKRNSAPAGEQFYASVNCDTGVDPHTGDVVPRPVFVTANSPVFSPASVGKLIEFEFEGYAFQHEIVRYISSTDVECTSYYRDIHVTGALCRFATQGRCVERMALPSDDVWLDCCVRVRVGNVLPPITTITGLGHLNGKNVMVHSGDDVYGPYTVINGEIYLYVYGLDDEVLVGLPYVGKLRTLDVDLGNGETARNAVKLVANVDFLIRSHRFPIKAGASETSLFEMTTPIEDTDEGPQVVRVPITNTWEQRGRVILVHDMPGPLEVLGIIPVVSVGGA